MNENLKEQLEKYRKPMDRAYYIMLVFNLLSHILQKTPMMLFIELLVRKIANGTMTEGQVRLLIDSMINLRLFIVIPAIYTILADMNRKRYQLVSTAFLVLGWFYSLYMREWNDSYIFNLALLIVASYGKDFHKILRYSIRSISVVLVLCMILTSLKILPSHYDMVRNGRVRHAFGMTPTGFAGYVCFAVLMLVFIKDGCLKWYDYMAIVIVAVLEIILTGGRVAFLCIGLLLGGTFVKHLTEKKKWEVPEGLMKGFRYLLLSVYVLAGGGFMTLVFCYRPEFYDMIKGNGLLESFAGRLEVPNRLTKNLGFSVFGNYYTQYYQAEHSFNWTGEYNFIDSSYARMYLIYGLIGFVLALALCTMMQWRLLKKNMIFRMYILAIPAVFFLVQRGIIDPDYNVFLLLIAAVLPEKGDWSGR